MQVSRRVWLQAVAATGLAACVSQSPRAIPNGPGSAEPDEIIRLWPSGVQGGVPEGLTETIVLRDNPYGLLDRAAHEVTIPSLSVFKPASPDGSAILIIPGGGYRWVVIDKEGFEGARHFSARGATVYVLRYRLPHQGWQAGADAPLQDAQRAMRVIRSRAGADDIDPGRVMVMGFSAGGHLAGLLATRFADAAGIAEDSLGAHSARPDAAALIYPVVTMTRPFAHDGSRQRLLGADPDEAGLAAWSIESLVHPAMPPVFLLHARDDDVVPVENALMLYDALRAQNCAAALHLFEKGGHGFGLRGIEGTPRARWPDLLIDWGRDHGVFL